VHQPKLDNCFQNQTELDIAGLLYFQTESSSKRIVPQATRDEVLKDVSGHLGTKKTMEKIKERFF
jgi:hypothetical protein